MSIPFRHLTRRFLRRIPRRLPRRVLRRFVVADRSMEPALHAGQGLIGTPLGPARVGQLRCLEHPGRAGFWLVKRVTAVDGDSMFVESDNRAVPTVDSNTFGPMPIDGSYRVVVAVPRRLMGIPE